MTVTTATGEREAGANPASAKGRTRPDAAAADHGPRRSLLIARRWGLVLVAMAALVGGASFAVLLGFTPIAPEGDTITAISLANGFLVVLLAVLVGREVLALVRARRHGRSASRLHVRIIALFGVVAALPAIAVAVIAGITLDAGLDRIFENRTRTIVDSSVNVARSYINQSAFNARASTVSMAAALSRQRRLYSLDRYAFADFLRVQTQVRGFLGAMLIAADGEVMEAYEVDGSLPPAPPERIADVRAGRQATAIVPPGENGVVGVITPLFDLRPGMVLYTAQAVDPAVLNSLDLMEKITADYAQLEANRRPLQIGFAALYVGLCLTVLLAAIWTGLGVADRLMVPIRRLIGAADRVRAGDLSTSVPLQRTEGDLRSLAQTFNSMVVDIGAQRAEILATQAQSDERRRFTEAVLSGVSAGVIGLTPRGRVTIANTFAEQILGTSVDDMLDKDIATVAPDLAAVVVAARAADRDVHREQVTVRREGEERTLNVQVTAEDQTDGSRAYVVTFDDITDLVTAQRTSAWADVARRIAHEIKNPLTPIQLSAERLKRRYGRKIDPDDRAVFDLCTETIVRQVGDIGRMVDEFSSFARMPKPTMVLGDLAESAKEALFLRKVGHPETRFEHDLEPGVLIARFDPRLMTQALGNLIKNAAEAIEGAGIPAAEGRVRLSGRVEGDEVLIDVIDNGKGLPVEERHKLLEPYMTTREKGTGLGLAIVGKIVEEHHGRIELLDAPPPPPGTEPAGGPGAMIRIRLPRGGDSEDPPAGDGAAPNSERTF